MQKKLKKAHKEAIPFTWDTTPVIINARGAYVEEMFLDAWTDFLYGGGWTDTEELTFREANWVLVSPATNGQSRYSVADRIVLQIEYKLQTSSTISPPSSEDRVFLFEEFVPPAYQDQLANPKQKKSGGLFSRNKTTRHATPPKDGQAPPTRDEAEFDAILRRHTPTKQVTLSKSLNGSLARAELGMTASTPALTHSSPSKIKSFKTDTSKERVPSVPQNGAMKGLFRRRHSQEPWNSSQPAPAIATEYDQIETRTMSGPSSGESGWGEDDRKPNTPLPHRREGERWIGKNSQLVLAFSSTDAHGRSRTDVSVVASPQAMGGFANSQARMRSTGHLSHPQNSDQAGLPRIDSTGTGHSPHLSEESGTNSSHLTLLKSRSPRSPSVSSHSPGASASGSERGAPPHIIQAPHTPPGGSSPAQHGGQDLYDRLKPTRVDVTIDDDEERLLEAALPPILGPPLPINPRDTVFSVIEGYGHHRTNSDGASVLLPPVPPLPSVQRNGFPDHASFASNDSSAILNNKANDGINPNDHAIGVRESYASGLTDMSGTYESERHDPADQLENGLRHSSVSSDFEYQPPPPIIGADDIAAIARQPSPGRVEHGIPLQSRQYRLDHEPNIP